MTVDSPSHAQAHHHGHHGRAASGALATATHATLHCLTGCIVGEVAGLALGVHLGLASAHIVVLATLLSYLSGFTLGALPVMKSQGRGFLSAVRVIWIGEAVSIGVMEIVMNAVDYSMGGMGAGSVFTWLWLRALLLAVPAGFIAAWPVNYWLIRRDLKACH